MPLDNSYLHRGGEQPLLGETIPEHFSQIVGRFPHREAVVSIHQQIRIDYWTLSMEVDRLARGMLAIGFRKGDRIGIWSTNNLEWLLVQLATARVGAVLVNINPAYRPQELIYALQRSEVVGLFTIPSFRHSNYIAMLQESMDELVQGGLETIILYQPHHRQSIERPGPQFLLWSEVVERGEAVSNRELERVSSSLDRDDPINIQYTSGTTGRPKAVELSHHNILNNAWFSAQAMGFTEKDRLSVPVPFYHCFGMVLANLLTLSVGGCVVIPSEHFDAGATLRAIDSERCTAIHGVPTMFISELDHPDFDYFDLSSLRTGIIAGAPCAPELMHRIISEMNCREILIGYGQTEASPLTHLTSSGDSVERRTETVGRNLPHQEVKVVSAESGETVPCGEIGEICFRGYHVMRGYHGDREATERTIDRSGWLHSGDLGTLGRDGYLRISGRLKEMIIRGGENIYPREIEEVLSRHPGVVQAAVFGVPDLHYGEEISAWIELHPMGKKSEAAVEEEIREYCREQMAHFKTPRYIRFVERFPMTVTGKLQKFRMQREDVERLGL